MIVLYQEKHHYSRREDQAEVIEYGEPSRFSSEQKGDRWKKKNN
jgi:hypothetical protein